VNKYLFFNPKEQLAESNIEKKSDGAEEDEDEDEEMESLGEKEENSDDGSCIVCMENERNCVILVCGHVGLCLDCASKCTTCPLCRKTYTREQVIKIFNA